MMDKMQLIPCKYNENSIISPQPSQGLLNPSKPAPGPSLQPSKPASTADDLVNNLLEGLSVNSNSAKSQQGGSSRPNYNSSFFNSAAATGNSGKPNQGASGNTNGSSVRGKVTQDSFNDLLGGFAPTSNTNGASNTQGQIYFTFRIYFIPYLFSIFMKKAKV